MPKRARHLGTSTYARRQREDISPTSLLHTHTMFPSRLGHASWFVTRPRLLLHLPFFKSTGYSSSHLLSFAFMVCTAHSTSPLDCPYSGDDVTCSNPHRAANSLRADVSKYRPEVYKSEKSKTLKKIHKVALGKLLT